MVGLPVSTERVTVLFESEPSTLKLPLVSENLELPTEITPLLARVYPNGSADVNHFHAAGGMGFVVAELLESGLLDGSAKTVGGDNLHDYASEPFLDGSNLIWRAAPKVSGDSEILRPANNPQIFILKNRHITSWIERQEILITKPGDLGTQSNIKSIFTALQTNKAAGWG